MGIVFVHYSESRSGGEICAGDEESNWPSHEPEYIDYSINGVYLTREVAGWLVEKVEVNFDPQLAQTVFVVLVRYYDGCTFGTTHGYGKIIGVFATAEEADGVKRAIDSGEHPDKWMWEGYFSGFESCSVILELIRR